MGANSSRTPVQHICRPSSARESKGKRGGKVEPVTTPSVGFSSPASSRSSSAAGEDGPGLTTPRPSPPPAAAVAAAEVRGDVLTVRSAGGGVLVFCVCKWRQLELFVNGVWCTHVESLQVNEVGSDNVELTDDGAVVARLSRVDVEDTLVSLARLCNRAAIPHELVMPDSVPRCRHCHESRRSHFINTICLMAGRFHEEDDYTGGGSEDEDVGLWTDATVLPPGTVQGVQDDVQDDQDGGNAGEWECPACLFLNRAPKGGCTTCRLCGARGGAVPPSPPPRPPALPDAAEADDTCGGCGTDLSAASPFCPATGKPHPPCVPPSAPPLNPSGCPGGLESYGITTHEPLLSPRSQGKHRAKQCLCCQNAPRNTVLMPCRHLSVCSSCAPSLKACPQCGDCTTHRLQVYA